MLPFLLNQVSFSLAPVQMVATGAVSSSQMLAATHEPRPWPLVVTLPLTAGLSLALWAGIGRLLGILIAG